MWRGSVLFLSYVWTHTGRLHTRTRRDARARRGALSFTNGGVCARGRVRTPIGRGPGTLASLSPALPNSSAVARPAEPGPAGGGGPRGAGRPRRLLSDRAGGA